MSAPSSASSSSEQVSAEDDKYNAGKKVSVEQLLQKDQEDESLRRYKEALLGQTASYKVEGDPRLLVVCKLFVEIEGRNPYEFDLSSPEKLAALKSAKIVMKEGAVYNFKIEFKVQNDLVSGLKYSSVFYKGGVLPVAHDNHMVGSYAPHPTTVYSWSSPPMMAPTGLLARGTYKGKSRFIDDDGQLHLEYEFQLDIRKDWA